MQPIIKGAYSSKHVCLHEILHKKVISLLINIKIKMSFISETIVLLVSFACLKTLANVKRLAICLIKT